MITRWLHENSIEYTIANTYAAGKGHLFEMFFGWRQTNKEGQCRMIFSRRDWEQIDEMVNYYNTFVKKS